MGTFLNLAGEKAKSQKVIFAALTTLTTQHILYKQNMVTLPLFELLLTECHQKGSLQLLNLHAGFQRERRDCEGSSPWLLVSLVHGWNTSTLQSNLSTVMENFCWGQHYGHSLCQSGHMDHRLLPGDKIIQIELAITEFQLKRSGQRKFSIV